jgi:hypothetical protein
MTLAIFIATNVGVLGQTTLLSSSVANGGFESGSTNWTTVGTQANKWQVSTNATAGFSGTSCAYVSNSASAPFAHAYTNTSASVTSIYRDITFPAGETTITLTFKWICNGEGTAFDRMRVWFVPTTNVPASTQYTAAGVAPTGVIQVGVTNYNLQGTWANASITIPAAYAGTTSRLVFQWRNDGSGGTNPPIAIDDITLISSCTGVVSSSATAITSSSATVNWTSLAGATSYNVRYRVVGSGVWTTVSNVVGTSSGLTGLTANTSYEYQVQANSPSCTTWTGSSNFYTGHCIPAAVASTSTYFSNFVTTGGTTNISNNTGAIAANGYGNYFATFSASQFATGSLGFSATIVGGTAGIAVFVDWNNDLDFVDAGETVYTSNAYQATGTTTSSFTIPTGTPIGDYRMRIVTDWNSINPASCAFASGNRGEMEDYKLSVIAPPACLAPTTLTSSSITSTSATISWTAASPAPASGYEYFYSTSATAPTAGTTPSGSTAAGVVTANITGLTANTTYYFWVRSNCGGSGTSTWAGSGTFFTGYCQPTGTGVSSSITNVVTSGGITNLSNASGFTAGGYANFTAFSCSQSAGGTINFTLTYVSDPGTRIFIDWNNDLDFNDAGEIVYSSNGYVLSTVSGSFTVPVGQATGNYRMRIVADWNSMTPIACPVGIDGETEDYTFTVAATNANGTSAASARSHRRRQGPWRVPSVRAPEASSE